jgi:DNA-binding NarL/FixJ family response regulator
MVFQALQAALPWLIGTGNLNLFLFRINLNSEVMGLKLLVADSEVLFVEGLKGILSRAKPHWTVLDASSSEQLMNKLADDPDVVIMDYAQPGYFTIDDLKAARHLKQSAPLLALSADKDHARIQAAVRLGVKGFVTKTCDAQAIIEAIGTLLKGGEYFCQRVSSLAKTASACHTQDQHGLIGLTARETEIVALLGKGYTNEAIAETLFISLHTVRTHRKNAMKKLGIGSISELVLFAVKAEL